MAPAPSTSSPRDHAADANPELARKKQRLSEERRGTTSDDSIIIEASEPEDIGTNVGNAIEIEDDFGLIMEPYSEAFSVLGGGPTPSEYLNRLESDIQQNCYIEPNHFILFGLTVAEHVTKTVDDSDNVWKQRYLDEESDFFTKLARVTSSLLNCADPFEPGHVVDTQPMRQALQQLLHGFEALSRRIIPLLPDTLKATLSRRDSAQSTIKQQSVGILYYLAVARQILSPQTPFFMPFKEYDSRNKLDAFIMRLRAQFSEDGVISSLAAVIRMLSGGLQEIKYVWYFLHSALLVFGMAVDARHKLNRFSEGDAEEVMGIINACILPAICHKHPRALSEGFHKDLVNVASEILQSYVEASDELFAGELYDRFVKSEKDAVIPESDSTEATAVLLCEMCSNDLNILARLLKTSWAMQAAKDFICSDIMDIRNAGVSLLRDQLVKIFKGDKQSAAGDEHPVVKYAVRFLRQNQVTAYIFGPESRAGLVAHSSDIIAFLAVTSAYTDVETDIIWNACSTSVEADFVKASFFVLGELLQHLKFQHLIYIAKKYSTTPAEKLGFHAIEFLPGLFRELEEKASASFDTPDQLELAFTSIDIAKNASISHQSESTDRLRAASLNEISRFAQPGVDLKHKAEIFKRCTTEIQRHTNYATSSVEILKIFLSVRVPSSEADYILAMLPVAPAVDELCSFVQQQKSQDITQCNTVGAIVRLDCIARLMALASADVDKDCEDRLFDHVFGEMALCNEARDQAWVKLNELATNTKAPSAATKLWQRYMHDHVPSLHADFAVPKIIEFISASLKAEYAIESMRSDLTQLLRLPLWSTLVRFAIVSADNSVATAAIDTILDLLFAYPVATMTSASVAVACHREFARGHIEDLCRRYEVLVRAGEAADPKTFLRALHLLNSILAESEKTAAQFVTAKRADLIVLGNAKGDGDSLNFIAQVWGPNVEPEIITVNARSDTPVSDLLAQLPNRTAAAENRVIAGGVEVSLVPKQTLAQAGVRQSGVILIRPKYTYDVEIDRVLMYPGAIEEQIIAHYSSLESFLDGPDHVAHQVYLFLQRVRTAAEARSKVTSSSATVQDLFPQEKLWRSMFSLSVLQRHLFEYARLGVADQAFIVRTLRLLAFVVLDETRPYQSPFILEIGKSLSVFLQEFQKSSHHPPFIDDYAQFVERMITMLFQGVSLPIGPSYVPDELPTRTLIIRTVYKALLTTVRIDENLWTAFTQNANLVELHKRLLLDIDPGLCSQIATCIIGFCNDTATSREVPNAYWRTLMPCLADGMQAGPLSHVYFSLLVDILHTGQFAQADEEEVRNLLLNLTSKLWSYQHQESTQFPVEDTAMVGLLRLMQSTMTILKSYKKPVCLPGLSTRVLKELLFPRAAGVNFNPLVHEATRSLAFELVRGSLESETDFDEAVEIVCEATHRSVQSDGAWFPGNAVWFRPPWSAAGLSNLGMTCYMNSLLQQLFTNLQFRRFIFEQSIHEADIWSPLGQIQLLFARMQNSTVTVVDTTGLAQVLQVQVGNQEDVHTFYTALLSRLEENLPDNQTKAALRQFFTGKSVTQVKGECGHVSSRMESFTELSITVKNKTSLADSLDEFVQGEPLEGSNKYMCMTCDSHDGGRLVNAMRRTCLEEIPDSLTFCLKRFTYEAMIDGENKVNDRFEFPAAIDMSLYKRAHLEDPASARESDVFELVGVIVHQGSLQYGHYWSYVRVPGPQQLEHSQWIYLEDYKSIPCAGGIREVQDQCFGGPKWSNGNDRADSGYVLFYQRRSYIDAADGLTVVPKDLQFRHNILPRLQLPHTIGIDIQADNDFRRDIESLFDNRFHQFIVWLLKQAPRVLESHATRTPVASETNQLEDEDLTTASKCEAKLGDLIAHYAVRVILSDPSGENKVGPLLTAVMTLLEVKPTIAAEILKRFCHKDEYGFFNTVKNGSAKVRSHIFTGVEKCLSYLRDRAPETYQDVLPLVMQNHASILGTPLDSSLGQWDEYLDFAVSFARLGFQETGFILGRNYLTWALDVLYVRYDPETRKRHTGLHNWLKTNFLDLTSVFNFVSKLLRTHVDLSETVESGSATSDGRTAGSRGWHLSEEELGQIFKERVINGRKTWLMIHSGIKNCAEPADWRQYAPGKLLGVLIAGEDADMGMLEGIQRTIVDWYDAEENELMPMLQMTLHYCLQRPDKECKLLMVPLSKNLIAWSDFEKDSLWFYDQAYEYAPSAVLDSIPYWAKRFLLAKKGASRQKAVTFLREHLFEPPPFSDMLEIDVARIRSTRAMCGVFTNTLKDGYRLEHPRGHYECILQTLELAKAYLITLQNAVAERLQEGVRLEPQLQIEYDESRPVLTRVAQVLDDLSDWEPETTLPTRLHEVRKSVEVDSEEAVTTDAEGDDVSDAHDAV